MIIVFVCVGVDVDDVVGVVDGVFVVFDDD